MGTETKPYRVKITGRSHPHKGLTGMADPNKTVFDGQMVRVTLDHPDPYGTDACYATLGELKRLADHA